MHVLSVKSRLAASAVLSAIMSHTPRAYRFPKGWRRRIPLYMSPEDWAMLRHLAKAEQVSPGHTLSAILADAFRGLRLGVDPYTGRSLCDSSSPLDLVPD